MLKKLTAFFALLVLLLNFLTYPSFAAERGDLNDDGRINLTDLAYLLNNMGQQSNGPADLNGDGVINNADYQLMVQILINLGVLPVDSSPINPPYAGNISLIPSTNTLNQGCTYNYEVKFDTATGTIDGIDVILNYNPAQLTINSVQGSLVFADIISPPNNNLPGDINFSGLFSSNQGYKGAATAATINLTVKPDAPLGNGQITFDFDTNNRSKTTDSNMVERGTAQELLNSVGNADFTIGSGSCPTNSPTPGLQGDIDNSSKVDIFDYNMLLTDFGKTGNFLSDLDKNNKVDIFDYNLLLTNFGR